ncbi:carboxylesterase family protein [Streptomyces nigrescens]
MGTETEGFAGLLRLLKERSGRSYGVLAGQVHMSVSTLHRYCNGDAVPMDFAPADRLARRCGATADELVELHRRWILADEARRRSRSTSAATTSSTSAAVRATAAGAAGASAAVPEPSAPRGASVPPETFLATAPTRPGALVGRDSEVERTAELLRMPAGAEPVLIVTGDPGAGKTALLDVSLHTARAAGMRVLRAEGAEPEAELAFSGLHQLLSPVLAEAEGLPVRQRGALLAAFGMNTQEAERDPLLIGLAAFTLLGRVAERKRLLVVVDDAHWIDADSLRTLGFVARRLHGHQVVLLIAARDTARLTGLGRGHRTLELGPLDTAAANQLLDQQRCPPTGLTRLHVLDQSVGNPLALIEFAAAHAAGRAAPTRSGEPLPPTERLERSFAHRWRQLPAETRQILLLAAADTTAVTLHDPQMWLPAEDAGLVRLQSGGVRFHHPLVRIAALGWVRDNISGFGGDPDKVTVFGQSAGAMIVAALLAAPQAGGLFRRAISQSGSGLCAFAPEQAERVTHAVAAQLGLAPCAGAFAEVPDGRLVSAVAGLGPVDVAGDGHYDTSLGSSPFKPVLDGAVLTQQPVDAVAGGRGSAVDLLIGTNADEANLYVVPTGRAARITEAEVAAAAARRHPDPAALVAAHRAQRPDASPGELLAHLITDVFTEGSRKLADAHAARSAAGTYAYLFRWRPAAFGGSLGSCHCVELPFVFDRTGLPGLRGPQALLGDGELPPDLASRMHRAWISFAATGDPGWHPYRTEDRAVQTIDEQWTLSQVRGGSGGA